MTEKATVKQFVGPDQEEFGIEIVEPRLDSGYQALSRGDEGAKISYAEAIDKIRPAADYLLNAVKNLDAAPQSVEVTFGVKLSSKAGAVIASASAEGNFGVKLTWKKDG